MRCASLLAIAVLAVILAGSLFGPVAAAGYIEIHKVTTNGDTTTVFHLTAVFPDGSVSEFDLVGDGSHLFSGPLDLGDYTVTEDVPSGWVLTVSCTAINNLPPTTSFEYIFNGVVITITAVDAVDCYFTNSPTTVGGIVTPANTLALVAPWLAAVGLVACAGAAVVVTKKRR